MKYSFKQTKNIIRHQKLFRINSKFNSYDVNLTETEKHDFEVLKQFFYLRRRGHFLAVRQKLLDGSIPDLAILDLPRFMVKEVLFTETEKRFEEKDYKTDKIKVRCKK